MPDTISSRFSSTKSENNLRFREISIITYANINNIEKYGYYTSLTEEKKEILDLFSCKNAYSKGRFNDSEVFAAEKIKLAVLVYKLLLPQPLRRGRDISTLGSRAGRRLGRSSSGDPPARLG